jgi:hypothetical protein
LQGYLFSHPVTAEQLQSDFNLAAVKSLLSGQ